MPKLINISKRFGETIIYDNFNLALAEHKINVILGPSGCGKSTLLDIISGVKKADSGYIEGFNHNDTSYLFQEPRLVPWKSVLDNITYVLHGCKKDKVSRATQILRKVGLAKALHLLPDEISGGMARRVAIARAFAFESKILILDEPFASLDPDLKKKLIALFKELWTEDKRTVLCVTHDLEAAKQIGSRIITLSDKPVKILDSVNRVDS